MTRMLWLPILGAMGAITWMWLQKDTTSPPAVLHKDLLAEGVHEFALSPDGQQIVFCDAHGLKRLSLKTGQQEEVLPLSSRNSLCQIRCITWRPDMSCIASVKNASAEHIKTPRGYTEQDLVVLDWGSKATHMIDRAPVIFDVAWSPDGKQVAWVKSEGRWERAQSAPRLGETGRLLVVSPAEGEKLRPKVSSMSRLCPGVSLLLPVQRLPRHLTPCTGWTGVGKGTGSFCKRSTPFAVFNGRKETRFSTSAGSR